MVQLLQKEIELSPISQVAAGGRSEKGIYFGRGGLARNNTAMSASGGGGGEGGDSADERHNNSIGRGGGRNEFELGPLTGKSGSRIPITISSPNLHVSKAHPSWLRIAAVVGFYIVTSIAMIMVNKAVLNQAGLPLFFLWGQLVVAVIILRLASLLQILTLPPVSMNLFKSVAPLIAINVVGLILNTLCLQHIDAVMYQVARSLILPMTVAMSPILQKQKISSPVLACCALISVGFLVGVFGERKFQVSPVGITFGVLSSFTTALHSFVIKNSFQSVKHNGAFDLVYYNNLFSAIFLAPILLFELGSLVSFGEVGGWPALKVFLFGTLLAGATGLLINLAGFLQIKTTSPITHTVSSAARGVLQTLAARILLGEAITLSRCIGITVTLFGSCAYSLVKAAELDVSKGLADSGTTNNYSKVEEMVEEPAATTTMSSSTTLPSNRC